MKKTMKKTIIICTASESLAGLLSDIFGVQNNVVICADTSNLILKIKDSDARKVIIDIAGNLALLEEEIEKIKEDQSLLGLHVVLVSSDKHTQSILNAAPGNGYSMGYTDDAVKLFGKIKNSLAVTADKYNDT